jgi:hypothetical protein
MASEHFATIGSGTVPHLGPHCPAMSGAFPNGRYEIKFADGKLTTRKGTGAVILNFEDASVFLGIGNQSISVTGVAAPLPLNPLVNRRALVLCNLGPGILYIGDVNVSTSNGFPLFVNDKIAIDCQANANMTIYGISDGTSDTRLLELA